MHRPHSITWTGDFREHTTPLEGTTRSSTLHCTTLHLDVQHCNRILLVQYSIPIFNSRLDVTTSLRHHFRTTRTLSIATEVCDEVYTGVIISLSNGKI